MVTSDGEDVKLEILKLCAEMSPHGLTDENIKAAIEPVYNLLLVRCFRGSGLNYGQLADGPTHRRQLADV